MGRDNTQSNRGVMPNRFGRRGAVGSQRGPLGRENKPTTQRIQPTRPRWDTVERSVLKATNFNKTLTFSNGCTLKFIVSGPTEKSFRQDPSETATKIEATVSSPAVAIKIQSDKYVFPVSAPWKFRDSWGDRRSYRDKRDKNGNLIKAYHGGVDIFSAVGQEVYAITDGTIIAVQDDEKSRTGKKVFLLGKDGIQYGYIHIDNIKVKSKQHVKKGDFIALTGRTGIKSSAPHTHFQMKNSDKKSVDPFERLVRIAGFKTIIRSSKVKNLLNYYHHSGDIRVLLIRRREELKRQGLIVQE